MSAHFIPLFVNLDSSNHKIRLYEINCRVGFKLNHEKTIIYIQNLRFVIVGQNQIYMDVFCFFSKSYVTAPTVYRFIEIHILLMYVDKPECKPLPITCSSVFSSKWFGLGCRCLFWLLKDWPLSFNSRKSIKT